MKIFLFLSYIFLFTCCGLNQNRATNFTNEECETLIIKSQTLMNNYLFFDEEDNNYIRRLDSALLILYSIDGLCPKYNLSNSMGILMILSMKKEYAKGIKYADSISDSIISPSYKSIIVNRFRAMAAQFNGNIKEKNDYIKVILYELQSVLSQKEIGTLLLLPDDEQLIKHEKAVLFIQYFYYRSQLEGIDKISKELDSLQINYKDEDGFESILKSALNDDFMIFNGY